MKNVNDLHRKAIELDPIGLVKVNWEPHIEEAKKVITYDVNHNENGYLVELFKSYDGKYTEVYMTVCKPGSFKGYHYHQIRAARYVCIKGKVKVILYPVILNPEEGMAWEKRQEYILSAENRKRLYIPPQVATGIETIGDEECWLINYPDPAYDPSLKDEQLEFTQKELDNAK